MWRWKRWIVVLFVFFREIWNSWFEVVCFFCFLDLFFLAYNLFDTTISDAPIVFIVLLIDSVLTPPIWVRLWQRVVLVVPFYSSVSLSFLILSGFMKTFENVIVETLSLSFLDSLIAFSWDDLSLNSRSDFWCSFLRRLISNVCGLDSMLRLLLFWVEVYLKSSQWRHCLGFHRRHFALFVFRVIRLLLCCYQFFLFPWFLMKPLPL